jgi:threonine dehydrogenase-like Zn-dependent dehydrogenase
LKVTFKAFDYTSRDIFIESEYEYSGSVSSGWSILRNGTLYLTLGPGYRLLKTMYCGICETDLSRRFLPFPLPQLIGHEVVAVDPDTGEKFVVEINDTCIARGDAPEIFCRSGLHTHCPGRMVLGIDRLPGGFGPFILAPVNAAISCATLPARAASLAEPFAAALHAVTVSQPREGDRVAVFGAGRLGLLIMAALTIFRRSTNRDFRITALARHDKNCELARILGADTVIDMRGSDPYSLRESQDIVFDSSGTTDGFEAALDIAAREVHLKSTNGKEFHGIKHLTEMVVDELSLLPCSAQNLDFHWHDENRKNKHVFIAHDKDVMLRGGQKAYRGPVQSAIDFLNTEQFMNRLPRFDIGIASSEGDIDSCIRPNPAFEISLIRPRGAVLFDGDSGNNPLLAFLSSGKVVRTSRCGNLREAIMMLDADHNIMSLLEQHLITHTIDVQDLSRAYEIAKSPGAIKVVVRHF